jgi:hypothetical protein
MRINPFILLALVLQTTAFADDPALIRWTGAEDQNGGITHIVSVVNQKLGFALATKEFLLEENRELAFNRYQRFVQMVGGIPIDSKSIRVWTNLKTGAAIQVEANVSAPSPLMKMAKFTANLSASLSEKDAIEFARAEVMKSDDPFVRGIDSKERFIGNELSRVVTITGKRGKHRYAISESTGKIVVEKFSGFPEADTASYPAKIFPIYEIRETTGEVLPRVNADLKYISKWIPRGTGDIYATLKQAHYYDFNFSPTLGETAEGRAAGKWSMSFIKDWANTIRNNLALSENDFSTGLLLQGQFATINIHPDAFAKFPNTTLTKVSSTAFFPNWVDAVFGGKSVTEMIPQSAYYGRPLASAQEILARPAIKYADNNPTSLMNDGFDELQVYYAINTLMEQLHQNGFTDPDLSTRPFNAFLFNPDISYVNNAFYTDDTINFTTYSAGEQNMARDNSTIWHELGHGIMDRLMGDNITLADTGGLSEGMADFVAAMVIQGVTAGAPFPGSKEFRIINKTGFFLTNEVHDDGEAYGGAMKDFLDAVVARDGQAGFAKVVDVILEAMRLSRDHPALTAQIWLEHIMFADSLGRPGVRQPGELSSLLLGAVGGRNFKIKGGTVAKFTLTNVTSHEEVIPDGAGSRQKPFPIKIAANATAHFDLTAALQSSDEYKFVYPVTVKVTFEGGPIQGAVHWVGEEQGPKTFVLNSEADVVKMPLDVSGKCDLVNRTDGSCVDYAYVQILDQTDLAHPHAKKRFYVQVRN